MKLVKLLSVLMLAIGVFAPQNAEAQTSTFRELVRKYDRATVEFSTTTIRKDGSKAAYSYTSQGKGTIYSNGRELTINRIYVRFSDRSNFQGDKDQTKVRIYESGGRVRVEMTSITWGNSTSELSDVYIERTNFGYFVTGFFQNGRRATKSTFAIYTP